MLGKNLPYVSLGEFPTPIKKLDRLGQDLGLENLFIKRDDLSGKVYGGNKIRKLEFVIGEALRVKAKEVMTFGGAGSNHALATAVSARKVGLRSISMLMPQHNAEYVKRNLLMSHYCGAELHQYPNRTMVSIGTHFEYIRHKLKYGKVPFYIPMGGSSPLGIVGFINAAFELKEQITNSELPEPDRIYVAMGTAGTAVGLKIGVMVANLKSQIIPVRVIGEDFRSEAAVIKLFSETISFLRDIDPSFPDLKISAQETGIVNDFLGEGYAIFTPEGMEAITLFKQQEGAKLDGTYTGKAAAALIHDARNQDLKEKVVLFWNTLNSRDFSDAISSIDYHDLPRTFHQYFEEEVQPAERGN